MYCPYCETEVLEIGKIIYTKIIRRNLSWTEPEFEPEPAVTLYCTSCKEEFTDEDLDDMDVPTPYRGV